MSSIFNKQNNISTDDHPTRNMDAKLVCLFCNHKFTAKELVFAVQTDRTDVTNDTVYQDYLTKHFNSNGKNIHRKMKFFYDWQEEDVIVWDAQGIPQSVKGVFHAPKYQASVSSTLSSEDHGLEDSYYVSSIPAETSVPAPASVSTPEEQLFSEHRLCPRCHCILPEDFTCNLKKITVGLYGGKRSGKTTYMTIVTKYLENQLSTLGLGTATVAAESLDVLRSLYAETCMAKGNNPTSAEYPPFPIVISIHPKHANYKPFFLIFQDVPGEAASNDNTSLINHPFTRINHFLGLVDVNMFSRTAEKHALSRLSNELPPLRAKTDTLERLNQTMPKPDLAVTEPFVLLEQKRSEMLTSSKLDEQTRKKKLKELDDEEQTLIDDLDKQLQELECQAALSQSDKELSQKVQILRHFADYKTCVIQLRNDTAEHERLNLAICTTPCQEVFGNLKCAHCLTNLHSMQLMLTKIDQWNDSNATDEAIQELTYCSELITDHTTRHANSICDLHLRYADKQVRSLLTKFPNAGVAASDTPSDTRLEWLRNQMPNHESIKKIAFTAVCSRPPKEDGSKYEFIFRDSQNILDPIFNICKWENLLPVDWS